MKFVEPIRDKQKIVEILDYLKNRSERDWFLFYLGVHVGLRISDLLKLKVIDIRDKTHIRLQESKTRKSKRQPIPSYIVESINKYVSKLDDNEYLFKSREGSNPITRYQAHKIISNAANSIGLSNISTHSMRKTFGFFHYKANKDIAVLMKIFNHSSPSISLKYIGLEQNCIDDSVELMKIL